MLCVNFGQHSLQHSRQHSRLNHQCRWCGMGWEHFRKSNGFDPRYTLSIRQFVCRSEHTGSLWFLARLSADNRCPPVPMQSTFRATIWDINLYVRSMFATTVPQQTGAASTRWVLLTSQRVFLFDRSALPSKMRSMNSRSIEREKKLFDDCANWLQ